MEYERSIDACRIRVFDDVEALGRAAADMAAEVIGKAIAANGQANCMFATGNSQFAFVDALINHTDGVDWSKVTVFHMDEYVGIDADHPAGFQRWIRERIVTPAQPKAAYYVGGEGDAQAQASRYGALLAKHPLDLCCLGIGENGHLAFNDPPVANFDDPYRVKVVTLDEACRMQQVNEGHFPDLDAVPTEAVTVTIPALMSASRVLAIVPEKRKAAPVARALRGPVSTECPASVLRTYTSVTIFLDTESAAEADLE